MQLSLNTVGAMKDQVRPDQLQLLPLGRAHVARHNDAALQTVPGAGGVGSLDMVRIHVKWSEYLFMASLQASPWFPELDVTKKSS